MKNLQRTLSHTLVSLVLMLAHMSFAYIDMYGSELLESVGTRTAVVNDNLAETSNASNKYSQTPNQDHASKGSSCNRGPCMVVARLKALPGKPVAYNYGLLSRSSLLQGRRSGL